MQINPVTPNIKMSGSIGGSAKTDIIIWTATVIPTSALGFLIDYSAAGFTAVTNVNVIAQNGAINAFDVPNVAIKGDPTITGVTVNITQGSNALVSVVGINVLGGPSIVPAVLTNLKLLVRVEGY